MATLKKVAKKRVIGIDPSSGKIACTISVVDEPGSLLMLTHTVPMTPGKKAVACASVFAFMNNMLQQKEWADDDISVYLEEPILVYGRNPKTGKSTPRVNAVIPQSMIDGAILAACGVNDIPCTLVNNKKWKAVVLENGNIDKKLIPRQLNRVWPAAYVMAEGDPDLVDSACVNLYGQGLIRLKRRNARKV